MRRVLALSDGAFLMLALGTRRGVASSIVPIPGFVAELEARGICANSIGKVDGHEELIGLTRKLSDNKDAPRDWIDYRDTPETHALRREMVAVNAWIGGMSLRFQDDGLEPRVNVSQRTLRRRFIQHPTTPRKDCSLIHGGRLWGGFWETLARERRGGLSINGEAVVEVDFSALFLRLACAAAGAPIRQVDTDPYSVLPGLEQHRAGVKQAVSALLFKPDLRRFRKETYEALPKDATVCSVRRALLTAYPALATFLIATHSNSAVPVGFGLFRVESDILLAALRCLRAANISALPLHDALLVGRSCAGAAKQALEAAAQSVAGVHVPVRIKDLSLMTPPQLRERQRERGPREGITRGISL
ncbi:hypothetical protein [Methylocystis sp. S23]